MSDQSSILVVRNGSDAARPAALWGDRLARAQGARCLEAPPSAKCSLVLDIASKEDVQYLVSGLRCRAQTAIADVDDELATLMRRAPCPLWTVQPWAADSEVRFAVAVVGVDPSPEARAAAHVAAALLRRSEAAPRLILAHGLEVHPAELARTRPWPEILASMEIERHRWIERLASELADPRLVVELIVRPVWAPELIGGIARCRNAHFIALGSGWRSESAEICASELARRVVRSTPCPMLTV